MGACELPPLRLTGRGLLIQVRSARFAVHQIAHHVPVFPVELELGAPIVEVDPSLQIHVVVDRPVVAEIARVPSHVPVEAELEIGHEQPRAATRLQGKEVERNSEHRNVIDPEDDGAGHRRLLHDQLHLLRVEGVVRRNVIAGGVVSLAHQERIIGKLLHLLSIVEPAVHFGAPLVDHPRFFVGPVGHSRTDHLALLVAQGGSAGRDHQIALRVIVDLLGLERAPAVLHLSGAA